MGSLGFTLASLIVMVAILSAFGALRKEQKPLPKAGLASSSPLEKGHHPIALLEQANRTLETSLLAAQKKITDLVQQLEALTQTQNQLQQQLKAQASDQVLQHHLNQQIASLSQAKAELESALSEAEITQQQLQTQNQTLTQQTETLSGLLKTAQAEVADLEAKLSCQGDAELDLQQAQAELSTLKQQVEQLTQETALLVHRLQQSQSDLSAKTIEIEGLRQQLDISIQEKISLEEVVQLSQSTVDALQQQLKAMSQADQDCLPSTVAPSTSAALELLDVPENSSEDITEAIGDTEVPTKSAFTAEDVALVKSLGLETAIVEAVDPGGPSGLATDVPEAIHQDERPKIATPASATMPTVDLWDSTSSTPEVIDLVGKSIVMTGTLTHLNPNELREKIQAVGGRVQSNPNSKTDYIVVGDNPGSKLQKAEKYGITKINEAQLLALLESASRE